MQKLQIGQKLALNLEESQTWTLSLSLSLGDVQHSVILLDTLPDFQEEAKNAKLEQMKTIRFRAREGVKF